MQLIDLTWQKARINNSLWEDVNIWYVVSFLIVQFVGNFARDAEMLNVLMFMFENYMGPQATEGYDEATIGSELEKAGFAPHKIEQALSWLKELKNFSTIISNRPTQLANTTRIFAPEEIAKLGLEGQGFILFLEQSNILNPRTRELVIDRAMALEGAVDLSEIKWVTLMTLFHCPAEKQALNKMQDLVMYGDILQ